MASPTDRVKILDRMRGFSIICMLLAHNMFWVKLSEAGWFFVSLPLTDSLGAPLFIFVTGAAMTLSMRKRPGAPASLQHLRSFLIFGVGIIFNSFSIILMTVWNIWAYNILMSIGLARFVGYYAIKLPVWVRCVLIGVIVVAARPLVLALVGVDHFAYGAGSLITPTGGTISSVLGWLLFNNASQNTFLPYFAFFLAGTIFTDLFITPSPEKKGQNLRFCMIVGAILVTVGLTWGFLVRTTIDLGDFFLLRMYLCFGQSFTDFPEIMSRNSLPWSLWVLGIHLLLGIVFLKFEKSASKRKTLRIYGGFSLSIYIYSNALFLVGVETWSLWYSLILNVAVVVLIGFLCKIWYDRWKGRYSLEWFIGLAVKIYTQKLVLKGVCKQESSPQPPLSSDATN